MSRIHDAGRGGAAAGVVEPRTSAHAQQLLQACRQFESLLYRELIHSMVSGSTQQGFFGGGTGGDTWQDVFESGLADRFATAQELGIAGALFRQLKGDEKVVDDASRMIAAGRSYRQGDAAPSERSMKIERTNGPKAVSAAAPQASPAKAPASAAPAAAQLEVSAVARELARIREAALAAPEVRTSLIESLRAKIAAGGYSPDARVVAERLLEEFRELGPL